MPGCQSGKVSICGIRSIESPTRGADNHRGRDTKTCNRSGFSSTAATPVLYVFKKQKYRSVAMVCCTFQLELCERWDNRECYNVCMSPSLSLSLVSVVITVQQGQTEKALVTLDNCAILSLSEWLSILLSHNSNNEPWLFGHTVCISVWP